MESAILHDIRCLSFSVVYKCRRIPSYDLKYTLTSLSSKVDWEYIWGSVGDISHRFGFFLNTSQASFSCPCNMHDANFV